VDIVKSDSQDDHWNTTRSFDWKVIIVYRW